MRALLCCLVAALISAAEVSAPSGWQALPERVAKCIRWDAASGDLIAGASNKGVFRSADQGQSWQQLDAGPLQGKSYFSNAVSMDPRGGRFAVFRRDPPDQPCVGGLSLDGGASWTPITRLEEGPRKALRFGWSWGLAAWRAAEPTNLLARRHHSKEIWLSRDAGSSWRQAGEGTICFGFAGPEVLLLGGPDNLGIRRSTDDGVSWQQVYDGRLLSRMAVSLDDAVYWLSEAGLIRSQDDGRSWQLLQRFDHAYWGPYCHPDGQQLVVIDRQGVHLSTDGAASWRRICDNPALSSGHLREDVLTDREQIDHRQVDCVSFTVDFAHGLLYYVGDRRTLFRRSW